jgi:hypothetical protein
MVSCKILSKILRVAISDSVALFNVGNFGIR